MQSSDTYKKKNCHSRRDNFFYRKKFVYVSLKKNVHSFADEKKKQFAIMGKNLNDAIT